MPFTEFYISRYKMTEEDKQDLLKRFEGVRAARQRIEHYRSGRDIDVMQGEEYYEQLIEE